MAPISIGEIQVPGGSGLVSARTMTLTNPPSADGSLELFFGLFAVDAPKKVLEKLCDRLGEELRPVFFRPGDAEARFEAALKQANKTILAFLYDHGLSLPGVKLRGAVAALAGGKLFAASRGPVRGTLYVPHAGALAPYALLDDAPGATADPKFFSSLQAGAFPDGGRLVLATSELFQALDDSYVRDTLGQADFAKASREIKHALRAGRYPVTVLSLSSPVPEGALAPAQASDAPAAPAKARPNVAPPRRAPAPIVGPDIGELAARALRFGLIAAGRGIASLFGVIGRVLKGLVLLPLRAPRMVAVLADRDARGKLVASCVAVPDRCLASAVERLNALPERSRAHFLILLMVGAVFAHGLLFSLRREMTLREAKAYEASLAELQRLEGDFEAGIIYENDGRGRELLSAMEAIAAALPVETSAQQKAKAEADASIARAKEKLRRLVRIELPVPFAHVEGGSDASTMAWFGDKLYVFSASSGRVRVISPEGAAAADPEVPSMASGVAEAAPARTGFILKDASGKTAYWNPESGETAQYADAGLGAAPILFYQSRLYAAAPDGTVTRRTVASSSLGSPSDVLRGAPADASSIATDGAVYLLYKDGATRKYMKGAAVTGYEPMPIDPAPSSGAQLWASADSDKLVFADEGGDRAFTVDKASGRLLAQYQSERFQGLRAVTADAKGRTLYVLSGDGTIYAVPIK